MINLHYKIRICQKIYDRVTMTVYVKCVVRFNVHKMLTWEILVQKWFQPIAHCNNSFSGELDDTRLIEGITGEKTIYKRRGEQEPEPGAVQEKPKRLRLVVDVSGSMYRFNGHDQRLERMLESTLMVMEALEGYGDRVSATKCGLVAVLRVIAVFLPNVKFRKILLSKGHPR